MWKDKVDSSWTLFLDRDGVINQRIFGGYIKSPDEFVFLPGVKRGLQRLRRQFSRIVIVTNQQGVGKGIMGLDQLNSVHEFMLNALSKEGITIDNIYFATNLREAVNDRRKPNSTMAEEAKADFSEIDFKKSIMVGDTDSDLLFGINLGMKTVLIKSEEKVSVQSDLVIENLIELANEFDL